MSCERWVNDCHWLTQPRVLQEQYPLLWRRQRMECPAVLERGPVPAFCAYLITWGCSIGLRERFMEDSGEDYGQGKDLNIFPCDPGPPVCEASTSCLLMHLQLYLSSVQPPYLLNDRLCSEFGQKRLCVFVCVCVWTTQVSLLIFWTSGVQNWRYDFWHH